MKPERNDPCACGSGKKYKKCCGLRKGPAGRPDYITVNRAVAYRGEIGRRREEFCLAYTALKAARFAKIGEKLEEETAAAGERVSCGPGCAYCCSHYVQASFLESEAIAYYLYRHEKAHRHFLGAYAPWREQVAKIEPMFQRLNTLGGMIAGGLAAEGERVLFKEATRAYKDHMVPCPFLTEGACSIYEVRPYVCAGYFSVSPPEWCEASHPKNHEAMHLKISLKLGRDVPYFAEIKTNPLYSLPLMVHEILEGGYGALATLTGVEGLAQQAANDSGVREALREMGVG